MHSMRERERVVNAWNSLPTVSILLVLLDLCVPSNVLLCLVTLHALHDCTVCVILI